MDFVEGVGRRAEVEGAEFMGWVRVDDKSLNGNEHNVLFRNLGGDLPELVDVAYVAGADRIEDSRGVGIIDIEGDGDLDIVVQTIEKPVVLLVNGGTEGHWLQLRLQGTHSNRDAIGARVEIRVGGRTLMREISTTGGYISGRSTLCHFGLGDHDVIDELVVFWPRGGVTKMRDVSADQLLTIVEGPASRNGK